MINKKATPLAVLIPDIKWMGPNFALIEFSAAIVATPRYQFLPILGIK